MNNSVTENMFILYVLYVEKVVVPSSTLTPVQVAVNVTQITVLSDKTKSITCTASDKLNTEYIAQVAS